jgi:hypothetical protein
MVAVRMLTIRLVAVTQSQPIQGIPRLSKPIQAILGKKKLLIFCGRKVMQGIFADVRRGAVTQSPVREDLWRSKNQKSLFTFIFSVKPSSG